MQKLTHMIAVRSPHETRWEWGSVIHPGQYGAPMVAIKEEELAVSFIQIGVHTIPT